MVRRLSRHAPKDLRRMAAEEDEIARLATLRAELYRRTADELERLRGDESTVKLRGSMEQPPTRTEGHNLRISQAMPGGSGLKAAANAKGYSLRRLARELGCLPSSLSQWSSGVWTVPADVATRIEALIGYAATRENWPAGIRS